MLPTGTWVAHGYERSTVDDREQARETEVTVALHLDLEAEGVRVLALDDPLGGGRFEAVAASGDAPRLDWIEDGLRVPLLGADPVGDEPGASGESSENGPTADRIDVRHLDGSEGPHTRRSERHEAECRVITVTTAWPPADPLSATERIDTWTLCPTDGLRARDRRVTFPAGVRETGWERRAD